MNLETNYRYPPTLFALMVLFALIPCLLVIANYQYEIDNEVGIRCNFDYTWCGYFDSRGNKISHDEFFNRWNQNEGYL